MTVEIIRRLLFAGIISILFHALLLSCHLKQNRLTPTSLPVQQITVSLGVGRRTIPREPINKKTPKTKGQSPQKRKPQTIVPRQKKQRISTLATAPEKPLTDVQHLSRPAQPRVENGGENFSRNSQPAAARIIQQATPRYQINPPPQFPLLARRRGQQGIVILEAKIDIFGKVLQLRLFQSSGYPILDRAALKAVRLWRFSPGTIGNDPHEMMVKIPIRFSLK